MDLGWEEAEARYLRRIRRERWRALLSVLPVGAFGVVTFGALVFAVLLSLGVFQGDVVVTPFDRSGQGYRCGSGALYGPRAEGLAAESSAADPIRVKPGETLLIDGVNGSRVALTRSVAGVATAAAPGAGDLLIQSGPIGAGPPAQVWLEAKGWDVAWVEVPGAHRSCARCGRDVLLADPTSITVWNHDGHVIFCGCRACFEGLLVAPGGK